jgi:hypothetical protein
MDVTLAVIIAAVVVVALVVLAVVFSVVRKRRRSKELRERFGPEYAETVNRVGDRGRAEEELDNRVKRVENIKIRPLAPEARRAFAASWDDIQARFVDDPPGAFRAADALVQRVMSERGYPVGDFEQRAGDISVDHPDVVSHYRDAHRVYLREESGDASTDDLRSGFVHYRELFRELLESSGETPRSVDADNGGRWRTA